MSDDFAGTGANIDSPAFNAAAVTPHDTNELAHVSRAIYVGGDGNLTVVMKGGGTAVTFVGLVAGSLLPIRAAIVKSTGTTATNILALW